MSDKFSAERMFACAGAKEAKIEKARAAGNDLENPMECSMLVTEIRSLDASLIRQASCKAGHTPVDTAVISAPESTWRCRSTAMLSSSKDMGISLRTYSYGRSHGYATSPFFH